MPQDERTGEMQPEKQSGGEQRVELPSDFYIKLLNIPPCKISGICNGCGRCEK